ncbi:MAG: 5-formyltetrahydrofolate cyclo-ligase [Myxococcota bacterium]
MTVRGPREPTDAEAEYIRHRVKQELRRRMKNLRAALPREARAARSRAAAERVVALEAFQRAGTVLSFVSVRAEIDPAEVVHAAREAGKRVALPRVDFDRMELLLHAWQAGDSLEVGGYGIPEPAPSAPEVDAGEVDLVLVPALAVDGEGYRIGYGQGFYDRLLPRLPNALRCALAYDFQLLSEVPRTEGDEPVHVIATDSRVMMIGDPGAG